MRVSSRSDYGVRALFELALRSGQGPVHSRVIATRQEIPEAYLHQVLGALSRAGLIKSTRGPAGGHELTREPAEISLFDILVALDGIDRKPHPHPDGLHASDVVARTPGSVGAYAARHHAANARRTRRRTPALRELRHLKNEQVGLRPHRSPSIERPAGGATPDAVLRLAWEADPDFEFAGGSEAHPSDAKAPLPSPSGEGLG
jgi:Rrf2 family protein